MDENNFKFIELKVTIFKVKYKQIWFNHTRNTTFTKFVGWGWGGTFHRLSVPARSGVRRHLFACTRARARKHA